MQSVARVHSFQSLGTLDGPGVRFVVFLQGCNLRCSCCHNPDTWDYSLGTTYTPEEVFNRATRYREYFKNNGGITVSGGEPLLQPDFVTELFKLCHESGINTCLDTSGSLAVSEKISELMSVTDRVLLDIKYTNDNLYHTHVGCGLDAPLTFLSALNERKIPTTLRQVIIPTINDNADNIIALKQIAESHSCVDGVELLPFRKICQVKYDDMGLEFPFSHLPEPTKESISELQKFL